MSQRSLTTYNPFSQQTLKTYPLQSFDQANEAVQKAQSAQKAWSQVPLRERLQRVEQALDYFEKHREQIALDISRSMGRPASQAKGELNGFFERARYMCSIAESSLAPDVIEPKPPFKRSIEHAPLGVIFTISAWNYPLLITVNSVVPALIAGNTVVLKHSSRTLEIGEHFARAFADLGGCGPLVQHLVLDHETTGRIIEQSAIDHVIFTGSVAGGREILKHAAQGQKFLVPQLELGGKDAAFVSSDADVQYAAESVVDGAVFNSGQSCCGIERAYVEASVYDEFVEKCKKIMSSYVLGDPAAEGTSLGPLANAKAADLMEQQVNQAVSQGAKVLHGGKKRIIDGATFFEPTLIVDLDPKMEILREENFGPLLPVVKVQDMAEAIAHINDSDYGLTSAIYTRQLDRAQVFASQVDVGTVFMNRCDYLDPALPWTGVKNSGCGSSLSKYGYLGLTRRKALHFKLLE